MLDTVPYSISRFNVCMVVLGILSCSLFSISRGVATISPVELGRSPVELGR